MGKIMTLIQTAEKGKVLRTIGGVDSGGGNLISGSQGISAEELRYHVEAAHRELPLILNRTEINLNFMSVQGESGQVEDYQKRIRLLRDTLFSRTGRTIFTAYKEVRYVYSKARACLDSQGREVDASIYGVGPNQVCLSEQRLSQKLTTGSAPAQLAALLAHEISHKVGANEESAELLQFLILGTLVYQAETDLKGLTIGKLDVLRDLDRAIESYEENIKSQMDQFLAPLANLYEDQQPIQDFVTWGYQMTDAMVCTSATEVWNTSRRAFEKIANFDHKRSVVGKRGFDRAMSLMYKAGPILLFCRKSSDWYGFDSKAVFGQNEWITVREFSKRTSDVVVDSSEKVFRVDYHDKESVLRALQDLRQTVRALRTELQAVQ